MCQVCTHFIFCVKKEPVARSSLQKWLWLNMEALVKHGLCHQLPRYRCTLCGLGFQFQYQLKDHSNTHTNFQIKCRYPRCRRDYKSESEYKRHYEVHTTEFREYTCTTCGKSCSTKKNLDEHMALHRDILRFQCESC